MEFSEEKFTKQLAVAEIKLEEIRELTESEDQGDVAMAHDQIVELINRLEKSKDGVTDQLMDSDKSVDYIKEWTSKHKGLLQPFREARLQIKKRLEEMQEMEAQIKMEKELRIHQKVNEEQARYRAEQQKEIEEATQRQRQEEEEWYRRKLDFEKRIQESRVEAMGNGETERQPKSLPQSVKLQKYTITPFNGDYKDWMRFWNQFTVEVDGSGISEISKFNYLLELVQDKPKDDILGLPHTEDGYKEAKRILQQTYGKDIKVHKALIKELEELPAITSIHKLNAIHDFYSKLARIVRTLTTMKKLTTAQSMVYTLMDKLGPVREVLVQKDDDWEEWGLEEMAENLRKYVERNPLPVGDEKSAFGKRGDSTRLPQPWRKEKLLLGKAEESKPNRKCTCVYCNSNDHYSNDCKKILDVAARRAILQRNRMCFNCTGVGHVASKCRSRGCKNCQGKHHTSICEKEKSTVAELVPNQRNEKNMSVFMGRPSTLHPTVLVRVGSETVRVMFDTGAGSSYLCTELITKLRLKPLRKEQRCIEQMYGTVKKSVEIYNITIQSLAVEGFSLDLECLNAEKDVLTNSPNPNIRALKKQNSRLRRLKFSEEETSCDVMPVHIILSAADYQRIRTTEPVVLGFNPDKDPGAEFTMLGWAIYGQQPTSNHPEKNFLLKTGQEEFEKLCTQDVLGIADTGPKKIAEVHEKTLQQLQRTENGHYETKLPWKEDHIKLPTHKNLATARLLSTTKKLERMGRLQEYDQIMRDQMENGIIEPVPENPTGEVVHYVPHQAVIRDNAETTKMRIVYDCSARENAHSPSLNDCLETGPPLQPMLFDIILRNRLRKFCVTGDIQKAFLQIHVKEEDRDAQRVLWYDNIEDRNVKQFRFTRVIFGATSSPYLLGATLQKHVRGYEEIYPTTTQALLKDTYVDDIQGGGDTEYDAEKIMELTDSTWRYVPTTENPSDLGTRGTSPDKLGALWFKGPNWLSDKANRPNQPEIVETDETEVEKQRKSNKSETVLLAKPPVKEAAKDWAEETMIKHKYWKLLRITSYLKRFVDACRKNRRVGPLTREEIMGAEKIWIQITQRISDMTAMLTLVRDEDQIMRCCTRINGYSPVFVPRRSTLARLIVEHSHLQTLHGGVAVTMYKVREKFWIPKLRSLVKNVRHACNYCKKYRAKVLATPSISDLPTYRTKFTDPFDVVGVDFAGPLLHKTGKHETSKAYVALFTCASTRAVYLRLCEDMTAEEFKRALKEFVARRGSPSLMVSDNAKTFQATKRWLTTLRKDDDLSNYLATRDVEWKFNLSRAPWWGGFFERLIGVMKHCLSKAIGRALLTFEELKEVLLDVETFMNNRPLCYLGEEFEQPVITPNLLLRGQPARFLEEDTDSFDDNRDELTKRMLYLKTCRENVRKRWLTEYLHALPEHVCERQGKNQEIPRKNSMVLIKDSTKNRANWKIGKITDTIVGKDGVTRGYKIRTGKGYIIERPLQLVCDLEISARDDNDQVMDTSDRRDTDEGLSSQTVDRTKRNERKAKTAAINRLVGVIANEDEED